MGEDLKIALISLVVSWITLKSERKIQKKRDMQSEFLSIIDDNKDIFKKILDINRDKEINYYKLKEELRKAESNKLFLYNKGIGILFEELYAELDNKGDELKSNSPKIKEKAEKIIQRVREIGGESSDIY